MCVVLLLLLLDARPVSFWHLYPAGASSYVSNASCASAAAAAAEADCATAALILAARNAAHLHCVCNLCHHSSSNIVAQACIILDQHVAVVNLALRLAGHVNLQQSRSEDCNRTTTAKHLCVSSAGHISYFCGLH
jgi:hypothetical protein